VESQENVIHRAAEERERETVHLGRRLQEVRRKKQQTYQDKLNGVISEEFWRELHTRWTEEESVLAARLSRLMQPISAEQQLSVKRITELANSAPTLYKTQKSGRTGQIAQKWLFRTVGTIDPYTESHLILSSKEPKLKNGAPGRIRTSDPLVRSQWAFVRKPLKAKLFTPYKLL
jgi:hypothetical protein